SSVLEPKKIKALDKMFSTFLRPFVKKRMIVQEKNISEQLDLNRKTVMTANLDLPQEGMTELEKRLGQHTKEVVILAFLHFKETSADQHTDMTNFLKEPFKTKLKWYFIIPSLRQCWNHNYQVILSYDDSAASEYEELWPQCEYWWANTSDPKHVISYLEERETEGRPGQFFAAGLNLTEDAKYVLSHPCRSLQSMTLSSYSLLLNWVKQQRPGPGTSRVNIICADFVGAFSNEFTQLVIGLNQTLLKQT
uniref:Zgc:112023 n=1 Tax=Cyprinus carpio TaxID=7962 RepID=A0A8C2CLL2_CYPCA